MGPLVGAGSIQKRGRRRDLFRQAVRLFIPRDGDSSLLLLGRYLFIKGDSGLLRDMHAYEYYDGRLLIGFFLSNLDVTIVSSSLTNITDSLNGFEKRSWIVTGYLATYTGSMAIWTKISDIIGRKLATLASLFILLAFSIGCGCAQTVNQL